MEIIISGILKGNDVFVSEQLTQLKDMGIIDFQYNERGKLNISFEKVEDIIKKHFEIYDSIFSKTRELSYIYARMIYTYYAKELGMGYAEIGRKMNMSGAGVSYSFVRFKDEIRYNKYFNKKFNTINEEIQKLKNNE